MRMYNKYSMKLKLTMSTVRWKKPDYNHSECQNSKNEMIIFQSDTKSCILHQQYCTWKYKDKQSSIERIYR